MGVNQFSDWSEEEWNNFLTLKSTAVVEKTNLVSDALSDAEPVDWRKKNAVQDVKDQGNCGSCWAFSAIGAIEAAQFIENGLEGRIQDYSEQQLVDCDLTCYGCQGGLMKNAFRYFEKNYLIEQNDYKYKAARGICAYETSKKTNVKVVSQSPVGKNDAAMKDAVAKQPVAIAVQANQNAFRNYAGGIMECQKDNIRLDHGILLVGWDVNAEDGREYYIVKNSWGKRWGINGFAHVLIDGVSCGLL